MTAHACGRLSRAGRVRPGYSLGDFRMAFLACLLSDFQVSFIDLNRFVGDGSSEIERMAEGVRSLRRVLAEEVRGRVAVVAGGDGVVRRLQPAVVLLVHYVAVGARRGVVHQV